jgi:hypothetical protein
MRRPERPSRRMRSARTVRDSPSGVLRLRAEVTVCVTMGLRGDPNVEAASRVAAFSHPRGAGGKACPAC